MGARELLLITRPWSFPMTIICVGSGYAYGHWSGALLDPVLLSLTIAGSVALHAMTNVVNDYFDFARGVDRPGAGTTIYRPHPIVHGLLSPRETLVYGLSFGALAMVVALALYAMSRPLALILGLLGLASAFWYSGPPLALKYRGLGELQVLLTWGPLMFLGGYYVCTGRLDVGPALASLPLGLLVAAVLLANNVRDIETDSRAGVRTIAVALGTRRALRLYEFMVLSPYAISVALASLRLLPVASLLCLASLPAALSLASSMRREIPADADPRTARLVLLFGLLYLVGIAISSAL
ncbi:MAG: 1,4-dihydroxy-2-naphthoate octaprenyltransferase [Fervidicoccaceae archaeon]